MMPARKILDELDKIRAFNVAAYELLGGKNFVLDMHDAETVKAIVAGVGQLLEHAITYAEVLDDAIETSSHADERLAAIGGVR